MKNGPYELIRPPEGYPGKRYRKRYAYEHHVVWWQNTGELVGPDKEIHHKNGHKRDNRFENLEKLSSEAHKKHHNDERSIKAMVEFTCGFCGKRQKITGSYYRTRLKENKFGKVFCNRVCGAKHQHEIHR